MLQLVEHHTSVYVVLAGVLQLLLQTKLVQHPNPEWRERLHMIHTSNLRKDGNSPEAVSFKVVRRGAKRSRVSLVPEVQTSRADGVRHWFSSWIADHLLIRQSVFDHSGGCRECRRFSREAR